MSTKLRPPETYKDSEDRYVNFGRDFMRIRFAQTQQRILRACHNHQRVLVISGNGVGKSYAVAALILAFLYTNPDSTVMGTSGTYSQFIDTMWRPMKTMWKRLKEQDLPGRKLEGNPEIRVEDNWFAKVVSPRDPANMEGRHAEHILVVVEEADKANITEEHFDSAGSSVTDAGDRMVAIANPPKDENNVVYEKMQSDRWHTVRFSSFESHNVLVDAGLIDDDYIDGLVDLPTLADDWEAWNDEPWPNAHENWDGTYPGAAEVKERLDRGELDRDDALDVFRPGFQDVKTAHHDRTDLDGRWYRRRVGIIPPDTAAAFRPFGVDHVQNAVRADTELGKPVAFSYDVARMGGDWNVVCAYDGDTVEVLERWKGVDHTTNFGMVRGLVEGHRNAEIVVDAQGEGSGVADRIKERFPRTIRFNAGAKAVNTAKFYSNWDEGLYHLGQFLKEGGSIVGDKIDEELLATARAVTFDEKYYSSRNAKVLKASSKDDVKDRLGRSPDVLDAAYMSVWAVESDRGSQRLTW